jgi:hypothetical protein
VGKRWFPLVHRLATKLSLGMRHHRWPAGGAASPLP